MSLTGVLFTHMVARRENKPPYFFSQFNFLRMKERGNTHFCFWCLSNVGFKPGENGEPTDCIEENGFNGMNHHDESHADGVIGNADKYEDPWSWLQGEVTEDFPLIVHIPSI